MTLPQSKANSLWNAKTFACRLVSALLILILHHFLPAAAQGKPSSPSHLIACFIWSYTIVNKYYCTCKPSDGTILDPTLLQITFWRQWPNLVTWMHWSLAHFGGTDLRFWFALRNKHFSSETRQWWSHEIDTCPTNAMWKTLEHAEELPPKQQFKSICC